MISAWFNHRQIIVVILQRWRGEERIVDKRLRIERRVPELALLFRDLAKPNPPTVGFIGFVSETPQSFEENVKVDAPVDADCVIQELDQELTARIMQRDAIANISPKSRPFEVRTLAAVIEQSYTYGLKVLKISGSGLSKSSGRRSPVTWYCPSLWRTTREDRFTLRVDG
jgi:hypothetical protein